MPRALSTTGSRNPHRLHQPGRRRTGRNCPWDDRGVLIWLNGAFGAGKTTVASALGERLRDATIYDPELVGYFLRRVVPESPTGDFQDLPVWRTLVASVAIALDRHYEGPLIVPMTVVDPDYFDEILKPIRSQGIDVCLFTLVLSETELRQRITHQVLNPEDADDDERIRQWRLDQVDRCLGSFAANQLGAPISNENRAVDDVVDEILDQLSVEFEP